MRRISLIVPVPSAEGVPAAAVARAARALRIDGHEVEVVLAAPDWGDVGVAGLDDAWSRVTAGRDGLAASAMAGLKASSGDYRVVFDPHQGYCPEDLGRMLVPLRDGRADLVVARRDRGSAGRHAPGPLWRRLARGAMARVSRPLLGASDPLAGLVALTAPFAREVAGTFVPVGSRFTVDLLLRAKARRDEVAIGPDEAGGRRPDIGLDDLRHLKRLADDHYGNLSRLLQFCAVGASGMVVDLTAYAVFQFVLARTALASRTVPLFGSPLDLAAAAALSIGLALAWNFSLNRRLTFSYARGGSLRRQFLTYALSNVAGVALSFSLRLVLPARVAFFARHRLAAALVGIVAATGISFSMARWVVFRKRAEPGAAPTVLHVGRRPGATPPTSSARVETV